MILYKFIVHSQIQRDLDDTSIGGHFSIFKCINFIQYNSNYRLNYCMAFRAFCFASDYAFSTFIHHVLFVAIASGDWDGLHDCTGRLHSVCSSDWIWHWNGNVGRVGGSESEFGGELLLVKVSIM